MTDCKQHRDRIASAKVSLDDLERQGRWANYQIQSFERLARKCLPEILALLPADIDETTRAALVRLRVETANGNHMTIGSINTFLSVYASLRDAMPPYPPRCGAARKRAAHRNFDRMHRWEAP